MEIGSSIVVRGPTPNHRKNQSNVIYDLRVRRKNSVILIFFLIQFHGIGGAVIIAELAWNFTSTI